ncbi:hypothetical protein PIIN_07050, partial [Serendipita indica DSM 11827]
MIRWSNGHREKLWMSGGVLWLCHFLPLSLPRARVLTYGYDADTQSDTCVSTQTMYRYAEGLAHALSRARKDTSRALVICHNQSLDSKCNLRHILVSTHGILFFGTPHFGVDDTFLARLKRSAPWGIKTTEIITKNLEEHSSELENIQSLYVEVSKKISSVFFCEDYAPLTNEKRPRMNVPYRSASIPGDRNATTIVLSCDHQNLVKFSDPTIDSYKTVLYHLDDRCKCAPGTVNDNWILEDKLRGPAKGGHHPSVDSEAFSVHRTCLQGTREAVLQRIQDWANTEASKKPIFWLCDIAGSGKSTVAMSVLEAWKREGTLGGYFFFSMTSNERSTIDKLCPTIARHLVQHIWNIAPYIAEVVERNPAIMHRPFDEQFRVLITGPLKRLGRRIMLVIDAIDECKSESQRKDLLDTLAKATQESVDLKIFITSRPDPVIQAVLESLSIKTKLEDRLHDVNHHDNINDIAVYVHQSLGGVLSEDQRNRLIEKANGLFIWASTACRMLNSKTTLRSPQGVYKCLLSIGGVIDDLYTLTLERTDPEDCDDILIHAGVDGSAKALVKALSSVLSEDEATNLIQFRHPTFVEFLRRCSITPPIDSHNKIYTNIANAYGQAASWCFKCLKSPTEGLKFNICQIQSCFYLNREVPNFDAKVSRFISRRLRYASSHWLFHIVETDNNWRSKLKDELRHIIRIPYILYWMEILSFTGGVPRALAGSQAVTIIPRLKEDTRRRMNEVRRFIIAFSVPIQDSAPRIYISALPFTPTRSRIHIERAGKYRNSLTVRRGLEGMYPGIPRTLRGHEGPVLTAGFSPDGLQMISGSSDRTIRLWDVATGQPLGEPLRGHKNLVNTVAFSPDGSRIVSGSSDHTIRLWDTVTGRALGKPLRGHNDW